MPDTFLEDLTAAADAFESDVTSYNNSREQRIAATASLKDALERVKRLKKELDPIVRNKLRNDPASLAAWESASHVERPPKKAAPAKVPVPQP